MSKQSIIYYCGGTKPVIEAIVSIYTLRQHYKGEIIILCGETSYDYLKHMKNYGVEIRVVPDTKKDRVTHDHWVSRWKAMELISDCDKVLHLDCDTLVINPVDVFFENIDTRYDYITTYGLLFKYSDYPNADEWKKMIGEFNKIVPGFNKDSVYIELGCCGWNKGWDLHRKVHEYCKVLSTDQQAMCLAMAFDGNKVHHPDFAKVNHSKKPFKLGRAYYRLDHNGYYSTVIWHCVHPLGYSLWWRKFWEARVEKFGRLNENDFLNSTNLSALNMIKAKSWPDYIHIEDKWISNYKDDKLL
jgi:hypothetical protein